MTHSLKDDLDRRLPLVSAVTAVPLLILLAASAPSLTWSATSPDTQRLSEVADMATGAAPLPATPEGKSGVWLGKAQNSKHFLSTFNGRFSYDIAAKTSALDSMPRLQQRQRSTRPFLSSAYQ